MQKSVIILTVLVLITLVSCAPGGREEGPIDYRYGTQGLRISFEPNLPPYRLFDTEPFHAVVAVENMGTFTVGGPGDKIYLSGFDPTIITGISTYGAQIPKLEGRGPYTPVGDIDFTEFKGTIRALAQKRIENYPAILLATACYGYETIASAQVCIDPNPFAPGARESVCIPQNVALGGGQGAPVAVTLVEVDPSPGKTRFRITIQNAGAGEVFKQGVQYLDKCSPYTPPLAFDEIDYVQIADVQISGISIRPSCKPLDETSHLRLTGGQGTIFCEFTQIRGQTAYTTPITIILRYGYRTSVATNTEIQPIS